MSGKKGQQGTKATEVPAKYSDGFLDTMDGRGGVVRTLKQNHGQLTANLGGVANLSYQELSLVRRIIHLERVIETKEAALARGGQIDEQSYYTAITTLSSLFSKIGMKRRAKFVGTLAELLSQQQEPAS